MVGDELKRILSAGTRLTTSQATGLVSKIVAVTRQLTKQNETAAVAQLDAFKNQVNGFANAGKLTRTEADLLFASADTLIDYLLR
jgi:hypothetical protein